NNARGDNSNGISWRLRVKFVGAEAPAERASRFDAHSRRELSSALPPPLLAVLLAALLRTGVAQHVGDLLLEAGLRAVEGGAADAGGDAALVHAAPRSGRAAGQLALPALAQRALLLQLRLALLHAEPARALGLGRRGRGGRGRRRRLRRGLGLWGQAALGRRGGLRGRGVAAAHRVGDARQGVEARLLLLLAPAHGRHSFATGFKLRAPFSPPWPRPRTSPASSWCRSTSRPPPSAPSPTRPSSRRPAARASSSSTPSTPRLPPPAAAGAVYGAAIDVAAIEEESKAGLHRLAQGLKAQGISSVESIRVGSVPGEILRGAAEAHAD